MKDIAFTLANVIFKAKFDGANFVQKTALKHRYLYKKIEIKIRFSHNKKKLKTTMLNLFYDEKIDPYFLTS